MSRPIGYYVHHHGQGHRSRALSVADVAAGRFTLLGTGLGGQTGRHLAIDLPDDRRDCEFDGFDGSGGRPSALHYAPLDHEGVRQRVALMMQWIAYARPALMVVDVSCEVAMLARIASVPTVCIRLAGVRDDEPHRQAFMAACALLAPFASALDDPAIPAWVREKTLYVPGLVPRAAAAGVAEDTVLVVVGGGGRVIDVGCWVRAARATPQYRWTVIGPCATTADLPTNLVIAGWVDDAADRIAAAGIVIGSGGDGGVGAVLAARRPFVCMPEERPFDEQWSKAAQLAALGAAILCDDPATADWVEVLAAAAELDRDVAASLDDANGPVVAADLLARLADRGTVA